MSNSFGVLYKISSFGESHSPAVGVTIDGCPSGYELSLEKIQNFLDRRRPGQSSVTSPRQESDRLKVLSGLNRAGVTLGTPLAFLVENTDVRGKDYTDLNQVFRPSHGDYTTLAKYGIIADSGGGRSSARETIARVIAGAVAEQILEKLYPSLRVLAYVESIKNIRVDNLDLEKLTREKIDQHPVRCPALKIAERMQAAILDASAQGDSLGGVIKCFVLQAPVGLGDPVFDKLEARLAAAMMSIPAVKGFEIGSGFAAAEMYGSEHNDAFVKDQKSGAVTTSSNFSGGIQAGISNGEVIYFRIAFKPVATIKKPQKTLNRVTKDEVKIEKIEGRHDACVVPRAVPIVEAMALNVLLDAVLRQKSVEHCRGTFADYIS
ncbi:MAG: chorismate synthase [Oligoflexales bacterium]|nr:chorismate synthase [Oligoflexales bacterium]